MTPLREGSNLPFDHGRTLGLMRLIWGALLAGQVIFGVIVAVLVNMDMFEPAEPPLPWMLFVAALAMLVCTVPVALVVRKLIYKQGMEDEAVKPQAYLMGNIIVWATVEASTLFFLVGCIVSGAIMPHIIPAAFAVALFVGLWPDGKAMRTGDSGNPYRED